MKNLKCQLSLLVTAIVGQVSAVPGGDGLGAETRSITIRVGPVDPDRIYASAFRGGRPVFSVGEDGRITYAGEVSTYKRVSGELDYSKILYKFFSRSDDKQGTTHFHRQEADKNGAVRGAYGYYNDQDLYRVVDYFADAKGFRSSVRTNEPGTNKKSPADVEMYVEKPAVVILYIPESFPTSNVYGASDDSFRSGLKSKTEGTIVHHHSSGEQRKKPTK